LVSFSIPMRPCRLANPITNLRNFQLRRHLRLHARELAIFLQHRQKIPQSRVRHEIGCYDPRQTITNRPKIAMIFETHGGITMFEHEIKSGIIRKEMSFNQKVWALTSRIPKGQVLTYADIARKLGTK